MQSDLDLIKRLTVTAPVAGQIMQVKVHLGEYAPTGVMATPLMLIGDLHKLVVRTDVDENDAWRVPRDAAGKYALISGLDRADVVDGYNSHQGLGLRQRLEFYRPLRLLHRLGRIFHASTHQTDFRKRLYTTTSTTFQAA